MLHFFALYYTVLSQSESSHFFHVFYYQCNNRPDDLIKDYITWQVVSKYIYGMSQSFVDAKRKFETARIGPLQSERWSDCLEGMITAMDMSLGRLFVDVDFDEATKNTVRCFPQNKSPPDLNMLHLDKNGEKEGSLVNIHLKRNRLSTYFPNIQGAS